MQVKTPCRTFINGVAAYIVIFILLASQVYGQSERQYPQDNDEDYYYNYYTPDESMEEVERQYPQDNDEDYYQNYYYDYKAGQGKNYQQYYYPGDDPYDSQYRGKNDPRHQGHYDDQGYYYDENDDGAYYPSVNQYD